MRRPRRRSNKWFYGMSFGVSAMLAGQFIVRHEYAYVVVMVAAAIYWYRADDRDSP